MRDQGSRAVGLTPVQRKIAAPEPAIGTQFQAMKLGEIVGVQLQQLRRDRLMLRSGEYQFEELRHILKADCTS